MKFDIGDPKTGKTFHVEADGELFLGRKLGEIVKGSLIKDIPALHDYEFMIAGASDDSGFPALPDVEGLGRKRVLLTRGKGMRKKKPKGLRLRKTVHGNMIDEKIVQLNLKVVKYGEKPLEEIFKKKGSGEGEAEKSEESKEKESGESK